MRTAGRNVRCDNNKINISPILKTVAIQLVDRVLQVGGHEDQVQTAAGEELATDAGFSTLDMLNTISCIGITMRRLKDICKPRPIPRHSLTS